MIVLIIVLMNHTMKMTSAKLNPPASKAVIIEAPISQEFAAAAV